MKRSASHAVSRQFRVRGLGGFERGSIRRSDVAPGQAGRERATIPVGAQGRATPRADLARSSNIQSSELAR
jgi:hypothetical protein